MRNVTTNGWNASRELVAIHHAYRELLRSSLDPDEVHALRATAQTGTPLGNDRFRAEVESMLARSVGQPRRGRPAKGVEKGTDPF